MAPTFFALPAFALVTFAPVAGGGGTFDVLPLARASAAVPRLECQTASALPLLPVLPFLASMNGFGARPLPSAICAIDRPEATDRSSSRIDSPSPSLANSSRCLIRSQLVRLPP